MGKAFIVCRNDIIILFVGGDIYSRNIRKTEQFAYKKGLWMLRCPHLNSYHSLSLNKPSHFLLQSLSQIFCRTMSLSTAENSVSFTSRLSVTNTLAFIFSISIRGILFVRTTSPINWVVIPNLRIGNAYLLYMEALSTWAYPRSSNSDRQITETNKGIRSS